MAGGAYTAVREYDNEPRTQLAGFFNIPITSLTPEMPDGESLAPYFGKSPHVMRLPLQSKVEYLLNESFIAQIRPLGGLS